IAHDRARCSADDILSQQRIASFRRPRIDRLLLHPGAPAGTFGTAETGAADLSFHADRTDPAMDPRGNRRDDDGGDPGATRSWDPFAVPCRENARAAACRFREGCPVAHAGPDHGAYAAQVLSRHCAPVSQRLRYAITLAAQ